MTAPYVDPLDKYKNRSIAVDPTEDLLNRFKTPDPIQIQQTTKEDKSVMNVLKNLGSGAVEGFKNSMIKPLQKIGSSLDPAGELQGMMEHKAPSQVLSHREQALADIEEFEKKITPIDNDVTFRNKATKFVGNMIGQAPTYLLGGKAAEAVIDYLPTALRNRAANAVINVTKGISNPKVAGAVGEVLTSIPQEVLSGVGTQAVVDPQSLSTPRGIAEAMAMSAGGSVLNGVRGWRAANPHPALSINQSSAFNTNPPTNPLELFTGTPDEARAIYAQLIGKADPPKLGWWESLDEATNKIKQRLFTGKSAFKKVEAKTNSGLDFESAANLLSGTSKLVHESLFESPMRVNDVTKAWEPTGKPTLTQLAELIPEDQEHLFKAYLLARHRLDPGVNDLVEINKYKHPDKSGDLARLATSNPPPEFEKAAAIFDDLNKTNLENRLSTDLISWKDYDWMKSNYPAYASASRSLANDMISTRSKRIGGSDETAFVDPIHALVTATNQTITQGRINQFANELMDAYHRDPRGVEKYFQPEFVKKGTKAAPSEEVLKLIDDVKKDGFLLPTSAAQSLANIKHISDVDPSTGRVSFMRDGQLMTARIDKDLAEAFSVFRPDPSMSKLISGTTIEAGGRQLKVPGIRDVEGVPRKLTSLALDMSGVGSYKDTFAAYIAAPKEAGLNPFQIISNPVRGLKEIKSKGKYYWEMVGEGGGMGGRYVGEDALSAEKTLERVRDFAKDKGIKFNVMHPIQALEQLSADLSGATRMGMYMRLRDNGMTAAQSAVEARRVLADPFQSGSSSKIRALAAMSSFFNTGLQEVANIYRVAKNDPARVALKGLMGSAIPSAIAWSLAELSDDTQIREMRNAPGGQMFDYIRLGSKESDAPVIGIPRPGWVLGQVFGTGMDTFLDATLKGEDNKKRWAEGFINQIGVNVVPLSMQQLYTMKSGQQYMGPLSESVGLIPNAQAGTDPTEMGNSKTSALAQGLAEITHIDPFRWDRVAKGLLTPDGYKTEQLFERALGNIDWIEKKPLDLEAHDIPLIQRYIRPFPTNSSASIRKFYDDYKEFSTVAKTAQMLETQGKWDDLKRYTKDNTAELGIAPTYIEMSKEIASIRKVMELTALQPENAMSPAFKKKRIDQLQLDIIDITRKFNESMKTVKKKQGLGN
jgi:hypothetical protein